MQFIAKIKSYLSLKYYSYKHSSDHENIRLSYIFIDSYIIKTIIRFI